MLRGAATLVAPAIAVPGRVDSVGLGCNDDRAVWGALSSIGGRPLSTAVRCQDVDSGRCGPM